MIYNLKKKIGDKKLSLEEKKIQLINIKTKLNKNIILLENFLNEEI